MGLCHSISLNSLKDLINRQLQRLLTLAFNNSNNMRLNMRSNIFIYGILRFRRRVKYLNTRPLSFLKPFMSNKDKNNSRKTNFMTVPRKLMDKFLLLLGALQNQPMIIQLLESLNDMIAHELFLNISNIDRVKDRIFTIKTGI